MNRRRLGRLALGAVGLAIGMIAVLLLREATLSTHEAVDARSTELVVEARSHATEQGQTLDEMVEAQLLQCRLEVTSDFDEMESLGDRQFRVVLTPALDETNERQFRGCVEDFVIDGLQINVLHLDELGESAEDAAAN
jgi:hypothetical protein